MAYMKGSEALLKLLRHYEVEYVFGIPGATEILFMDELEKHPQIQYILGLNESVCLGMAEGYARSSGKPAFLNLHTGPGMASAMPLLINAVNGRVPMVITVGQNDSRLLQKEPQLSGNIVGMAASLVKWSTEIYHAEDIPVVLHRAFKLAMQAPRGPVVISLPQDVLGEEFDFSLRPAGPQFSRFRADAQSFEKAAEIIRSAAAPVMLVQEGVAQSKGALHQVVRLAELIGAPVYQAWMADVNFPNQHPLYYGDIETAGPEMKALLERSDLLIGVGCQLFNDAFYKGLTVLPTDLNVIQINDDPWEIAKNFPVDCAMLGDVCATVTELCDLLEADEALRRAAGQRLETARRRSTEKKDLLQNTIDKNRDNSPIAIPVLMDEIRKALPQDAIVVDDCWSSSPMLRSILDLKEENTYFRPRNGGSIGSGLPCTAGVKLANPSRPVVGIVGDGSAAWCMQSLWTSAKYRIPATFLVVNNATYRQVKTVRKIILGDYPLNEKHVGMELDDPIINFSALSESMGVKSCRVRNREELESALRQAFHGNEPFLIEVFAENNPA